VTKKKKAVVDEVVATTEAETLTDLEQLIIGLLEAAGAYSETELIERASLTKPTTNEVRSAILSLAQRGRIIREGIFYGLPVKINPDLVIDDV